MILAADHMSHLGRKHHQRLPQYYDDSFALVLRSLGITCFATANDMNANWIELK